MPGSPPQADGPDAVFWIDTDPGIDDAVALLLAVREVGARLVGMSSVQGNVEEPESAHNLRRLLSEMDRRGLLAAGWDPVLCRGSQAPLVGGRVRRAYSVHGGDGLGGRPWAAAASWVDRGSELPAAAAIAHAARVHGERLQLVCLGPLTNLAIALREEPRLPSLVGGLTVMGGSLRAGGNETMAAEFNFAADAEAARDVLAAGFRDLRLVPLDGCLEARMIGADLERVVALGTPAAGVAAELLAFWQPRIRAGGQGLYDPIAWLLTTHPELGRWESVYVAVDTGGDVAHGASLADWRGRSGMPANVSANVHVAHAPLMDVFCGLLT